MVIFRSKQSVKKLRWPGLALIFTFGLIAIIASGGGGGGSDDDNPDNGSNGGSGATYDFTGEWDATLKSYSFSGPCYSNDILVQQGTATIVQTGNTFTLTFGAGFSCNPASACVFTGGTVSGADYAIENAGDVGDGEGGKYRQAIGFTASSATKATGLGNSHYTHPDGDCDWLTSIILNKKEE